LCLSVGQCFYVQSNSIAVLELQRHRVLFSRSGVLLSGTGVL
jgi:hypothetical protein